MVKGLSVRLTERALRQRIDRKLNASGQALRKIRSADGVYVHVDVEGGQLIANVTDVEKFGRKLGVLEPWEKLERA